MHIEPATSRDHEEITRLWETSVRATHAFLSEADIQFFRPLMASTYLPAVRLYCIRGGEGRILAFLGSSEAQIEMLFVHPEHFGKGLGSLLLTYATDTLGIRKVDVNEQNEGAAAFYRKAGFRVTGRSPLDGSGKPYPLLHLELD